MSQDSLGIVRSWMHHNGELPTDEHFKLAMIKVISEWSIERASGMDVLATTMLEEIIEIGVAMRDLT